MVTEPVTKLFAVVEVPPYVDEAERCTSYHKTQAGAEIAAHKATAWALAEKEDGYPVNTYCVREIVVED